MDIIEAPSAAAAQPIDADEGTWSAWAITALVFGVVGVTVTLPVALYALARVHRRRGRLRGRGLAVAAIVLGALLALDALGANLVELKLLRS